MSDQALTEEQILSAAAFPIVMEMVNQAQQGYITWKARASVLQDQLTKAQARISELEQEVKTLTPQVS